MLKFNAPPLTMARFVNSEQTEAHARELRLRFRILTKQESRVAALLAEGLSNGEIAEALSIAIETADNYASSIRRKLIVPRSIKLGAFFFGMLNLTDLAPQNSKEEL